MLRLAAHRVLSCALVAIVVASAGCPPPELPPDVEPDSNECVLDLNVDTTAAQAIVDGTPVEGILCPAFDQDYYAFDVVEAGTIVELTLSMATAITSLDPAYRIIKDNGTPLGAPTPFSAEDPDNIRPVAFTAAHRISEPGRYFVLVFDSRGADDGFDIVNPYTLGLKLLADPDDNEPNDNGDTATVVATDGTSVTGQVGTTGDEDWYAIDVPVGAKIVDAVVTANADSTVKHEAILIAADATSTIEGGPLDDTSVAGSISRRLRARVVGGSRAYLVVRDTERARADLSETGRYTVSIEVLDNPDANETPAGNDTVATATRVTSGTSLTSSLATKADQDFYRVSPGTFTKTAPGVLIVSVDIVGVDVARFRPQLTVIGDDVEATSQACVASCAACDANVCKTTRLQRFIREADFVTAYPLRSANDVLVVINEFGDDAFQDGAGYTIRFEVIRDPDPGERGDDFLIPNLEFAGFANGADLARQFDKSVPRARALTTNYPPVCTGDATDPEGCLPLIDVPAPIAGINPDFTTTVDCSAPGTSARTVTATGRLSYEGDRDYFKVDVPDEGYWALDFRQTASGVGNTPVELAMFVHADGVIANSLEAEKTLDRCEDTSDCPSGSICVDRKCWAERDDNPTFNNKVFPRAGECSFVSVTDRGDRPIIIEVTDNGINDFDVDLTYSFQLTIRCGCPAACEVGGGLTTRCQGVAPPN